MQQNCGKRGKRGVKILWTSYMEAPKADDDSRASLQRRHYVQEMTCCSFLLANISPFVPHSVLSPEGKFQTEPERGGDNELRSSSKSRTIEWQPAATTCERMLGREKERALGI